MTEKEIQLAIYYSLPQGCIIIPNIRMLRGDWEADLCRITQAKYLYEYEIKSTYDDFKRDRDKRKHKFLARPIQGHPNYLSYVCEENLIPTQEVADPYGLIYVKKNWKDSNVYEYLYIIKKPQKIHKHKLSDYQENFIKNKFQFKYWGLHRKLFYETP